MKTGIIFDMDGALWDPAEQIADAWTGVVRHFPIPTGPKSARRKSAASWA